MRIPKATLIKIGKIFSIILGAALLILAGFYLWQNYGWKIGIETSCVKIESHNIVGNSLEPLLKEGTKVKGLVGYYDCNEIKRGEIAILKFKTREETFVKKVVGIPGDKLEFQNDQAKLNDEVLINSAGEPYLFSEASRRIITIPLRDGKIPEARYFILSDEKWPSAFDSRQFGFVEKEHLIGRVIK